MMKQLDQSNDDNKQQRRRKRKGRRKRSRNYNGAQNAYGSGEGYENNEGEGQMELLVKYTTKEGMHNACKHGTLKMDMEMLQIAAIMVPEDTMKEMYMNMMHEDGVEMVTEVTAYSPLSSQYDDNMAQYLRGRSGESDEEENVEVNERKGARVLQDERVPYGIDLIQARELVANADRQPEPITICVGKNFYNQVIIGRFISRHDMFLSHHLFISSYSVRSGYWIWIELLRSSRYC